MGTNMCSGAGLYWGAGHCPGKCQSVQCGILVTIVVLLCVTDTTLVVCLVAGAICLLIVIISFVTVYMLRR